MAYDTLCRPTGRRRLPKADLHISPPHNKGYPTGMAFTNCSLAYFAASPRIARGRTWRLPFAYFLISSPVRTIAGTSAGVYHSLACISRRQSGHVYDKHWRLPIAYLHISPPVRILASPGGERFLAFDTLSRPSGAKPPCSPTRPPRRQKTLFAGIVCWPVASLKKR